MAQRIYHWTTNILIIIILTIAVSVFSYNFFLKWNRPITFQAATAPFGRVVNGQPLIVDYAIVRSKLCKTDIDRFVYRVSDGTVVWRDRGPGGSSNLGYSSFKATVQIPRLTPGFYVYRAFWQSECDGDTFTDPSPDIPFEVTNND